MNKQALSLAVFVAGAYPLTSNALSLGDIESNSNLNQPLRAKIELLSTSAQEAQQLQVRLAPPSVFNRVGIDRPAFLNNLRFTPSVQNGKPVILVSSDSPIREPFVNFLLEVNWPQGQLLKEYTVMLDPPVLMQAGNNVANNAAVRAEPSARGSVARPAPAPAQVPQARASQQPSRAVAQRPEPRSTPQPQQQRQVVQRQQPQRARPAPAPRRAAQSNARRTYRVKSGDTLYGIASKVRQRGTSVDQVMMALYRANPKAFIKSNINGLRKGARLGITDASDARSLSRDEARQQVRQQYKDWKAFRSKLASSTAPQQRVAVNSKAAPNKVSATDPKKARLEVLGNKANAAANSATAAAGKQRLQELERQLSLAQESLVSRQRENAELKSKVADLESMLKKKNQLIALRDTQLAQLQKNLNGQQAQSKPAPPKVAQVPATPAVKPSSPPVATAPGDNARPGVNQQNQGAISRPPMPAPSLANDIRNAAGANNNNNIVRAQPTPAPQPMARPATPPVSPPAVDNNNAPKLPEPANSESTKDANEVNSPFADQQQDGENDLLSMLTSPLALQIGGGALGGLALLALLSRFFGRRRKNKDEEDMSAVFDMDDDKSGQQGVAGSEVFAGIDDEPIKTELDKSPSTLDEYESFDDSSDVWGNDGDGKRSESEKAHADKSDVSDKTDMVEEEDDVLMESNVYIAYGLHQQAESELKKAIEKHPERLEYREKLLENYFSANDRESFDAAAEEFAEKADASHSKLWDQVTAWGKKISPDNKLYQSGISMKTGALAAGGAALAAGAGAIATSVLGNEKDKRDDFDEALKELDDTLSNQEVQLKQDLTQAGDSLGEKLENPQEALPDLDLDMDMSLPKASLGEVPALEVPALPEQVVTEMDDLDFDLDFADSGKLEKEESLAADEVSSALGELADLDFDPDELDKAVRPDVKPSIAEVKKVAESAKDDLQEQTAEVVDGLETLDELDDLDFSDLLDESDEPAAPSLLEKAVDAGKSNVGKVAATAAATAAGVAAVVKSGADKTGEAASNATDKVSESGAALVEKADGLENDFDLSDLLDDDAPQAATPAASGAKEAKVTDLELHIKDQDLNKILPEDNLYTKVNTPSANESSEDEWLGDIDDALSFLDLPDEEIDLHEAHISTKLDLARAYLDMGDIEGARSTLEEVMVEGNDDQRREAEDLLHQAG